MMDQMFGMMTSDPEMRKMMAERMLKMLTAHPDEFKRIFELKKKLQELLR